MSVAHVERESDMRHFMLVLSLSVALGAVPGAGTFQRPQFTGF